MSLSKQHLHFINAAASEKPIKVFYRSHVVWNYVSDVVVDDKVLLELKVVKKLRSGVNYLNTIGVEVGFLINLGLQ